MASWSVISSLERSRLEPWPETLRCIPRQYFTLTVPLFTHPGGSGNSPRLKFSLAKIIDFPPKHLNWYHNLQLINPLGEDKHSTTPVCILSPVCSLQSAVYILHWPARAQTSPGQKWGVPYEKDGNAWHTFQGQVVWKPVSANPGLKVNRSINFPP